MHTSRVGCTLSLAPPAMAGPTLVTITHAVTAALWLLVAVAGLADRGQHRRHPLRR